MVPSLKDACKVLGIEYPVVSTRWEVSKQFNQAAMKNHPDKVGPRPGQQREANKRMSLVHVSAARELLDFRPDLLFEREAWKGTSTPLVCCQNEWNCKPGDKIW